MDDLALVGTLRPGKLPLLVSLPHAGFELSPGLEERLTPAGLLRADTDWHVERLYEFVPELGASLLHARYSRYLIDLNRDPSGASLYPGKSTTEICPTSSFSEEKLYLAGAEPSSQEIAQRITQYYEPYHQLLAQELARLRSLHGYVILLEGHSIRSRVPRFFDGKLPDLNLGTADGVSCAPGLEASVVELLASQPRSWVNNGRFKGGYITRHYANPEAGVHTLQLEVAQAVYMQEEPPFAWDPERARPFGEFLSKLIGSLLSWRPR